MSNGGSMKKYADKQIKITTDQMELIHKLDTAGKKIISFSLIYMNDIFANEEGQFDCSNETLQNLTLYSDEQVRKIINMLIENDYLHCVYRNELKKVDIDKRNYRVNKKKNRYALKYLKSENQNIFYKFKFIDTKKENILFNYYVCYRSYMEKNDIKLPRRFKEQYNKYVS
jgi:hypothetical protein